VAAVTPLDRIVVETDSPYLSPVPLRGKRNDSRNLPYIIEKLAEWKGVSPEEMTRITWENGLRLFRKISCGNGGAWHV
jgi:TatD DNase family protein